MVLRSYRKQIRILDLTYHEKWKKEDFLIRKIKQNLVNIWK